MLTRDAPASRLTSADVVLSSKRFLFKTFIFPARGGGILVSDGEVSERFKELVLKTSDPARDRGFESRPLRHFLAA